MSKFGLTINKNKSASLGGLATQAMPLLGNTTIANAVTAVSVNQNPASPQSLTQKLQTDAIAAQILPPVVINPAVLTPTQTQQIQTKALKK